ncbi:MAG: hypothetical protein VXV86_03860 [Verrucomicrobiota bacterium]|nr:hypothetical protein [Verrucomicrobiota bacterium]
MLVAVISGLVTKEWVKASVQARKSLYIGLSSMILGVVILAASQYIAATNTTETDYVDKAVETTDL